MTKRANGEGTVRQRPNGDWEARISYRDERDQLVRRSFYGKTAAQARTKMRAALARVADDLPPVDATITVADWVDQWLTTILPASNRKESTKSLYRTLSRTHLQRAPFGALTLAELKARNIDSLIGTLRTERNLSESSVRTIYTVLRSVLDGAKRDTLIATNPAERVPRPTVSKNEAKHIDGKTVSQLLDAAKPSRHYAALALIAATGVRRGEALGLTWADVDLDKGTMLIRSTLGRVNGTLTRTPPKTENSRRTVILTASAVTIVRKHRAAQLEERLRAGNQWQESDAVFATELGAPVDPRNLYRAFQTAATAVGLEGVGLHTLRHSAATAMLDAGVPLHVVSRILGHSSVSITGDIYGHVVDSTQREAMDTLSAALGL